MFNGAVSLESDDVMANLMNLSPKSETLDEQVL